MENESLREPRSSALIFVSLIAVALAIWAIAASVTASSRGKEITRLTSEKEAIRIEAEQIKQDAMQRSAEAEKLRQTALEWTRQHQMQIQADMRKKAEEAAKAAKAKEELKKPAAPAKATHAPAKKSPVKKAVKKTRS